MGKTAVITTRIDPGLKKDVSVIFDRLGISATEAINLFYKMVKKKNSLPFEAKIRVEKAFKSIGKTKQQGKDIGNKRNKALKDNKGASWLGCLEDCTEIRVDIVSPVMDENQWEVLSG